MFRSIRWSLQLWHAGILGLALASFGTALYIGYDNGANVTTGNVSVTMSGGSPDFTNTFVKSNGGAVMVGI